MHSYFSHSSWKSKIQTTDCLDCASIDDMVQENKSKTSKNTRSSIAIELPNTNSHTNQQRKFVTMQLQHNIERKKQPRTFKQRSSNPGKSLNFKKCAPMISVF